jgi:DNA-binding CsgD family transcriptional regulator
VKPLLEYLRARSDEVGQCWEWTGALQGPRGAPVMRHDGVAQPVRRVIAEQLGLPVRSRMATVRCCNNLCVNPAHVVVLTRKQLQQRTAKVTQLHADPLRCRKLAQTARRTAKLTEAQVIEIRSLDGLTQRQIAAQYGVSQSTVSAIRRGVKWKDYSNPWLQLLKVNP